MFQRLLQNHVLANLTFILVMIMGVTSYLLMPREQDPSINFNWIDITTIYPGASTPDVERQVTDVLEDAIDNVSDIKFVSSTSRDGVSSLLVRFEEIDERTFDKRLADLRREIEGVKDTLPDAVIDPFIFEITTDNAFPTATVVISGQANDDNLRRQSEIIKSDIERLKGVGRILENGITDPEMQIRFKPDRLEAYGVTPVDLENTILAYYTNLSAGSIDVGDSAWSVKVEGTDPNPDHLANLPVVTREGEIRLRDLADVVINTSDPERLVSYRGKPSILLSITKKEKQNMLQLVERIQNYLETRQPLSTASGVTAALVDDQTEITRNALRIMQNNALLGLLMVLLVTWVFLGTGIALLTGIAIPFILAGTFWFLSSIGQTLNVQILLGVVISLGMLVDDAVVVVESIYYRLQRGADTLRASVDGLREVMVPVTTAVLTTMAAFLPLMLLPGILGKFMIVIPMVVTTALAISLVEAYWLLPAHIIASGINFNKPSRIHRLRERFQFSIRKIYCRILLVFFRCPLIAILLLLTVFGGTIYAVASERIKVDFFASDTIRLYYVNIQMPPGTSLERTMQKVLEIESAVNKNIRPGEARSVVSYAGQLLTETEPFFGDQYGQILVSLNPKTSDLRSVEDMIEAMRSDVESVTGLDKVNFLRLAGGPPVTKPVNLKVRGNDRDAIVEAMEAIKAFMQKTDGYIDITDDDLPGRNTLSLELNSAAVQRTGIPPQEILRTLRLLVDGEVITDFQHLGEKVDVRLKADHDLNEIDELLQFQVPDNTGSLIPLSQLVHKTVTRTVSSIRHYNFRRAITLEADIDKSITDTVTANDLVKQHWEKIRVQHPGVDLDFTGVLDDINESVASIGILFLFGIGLIYLILGTQFRSYFQPLLIIMTVPMAFSGVVVGLLISQYPLSLYTLYGVVALAGIAVNAAIVLISTANAHLARTKNVTTSIYLAARRRVIPIIITSLTTIAGLFSLATGLGGSSLIWGPVAASMVFGLGVSTILTLFYIPLLYRLFMSPWTRLRRLVQVIVRTLLWPLLFIFGRTGTR
ncbi:MAG: efflux RND transporter permease subunit [Pseudomonadota bacterium]